MLQLLEFFPTKLLTHISLFRHLILGQCAISSSHSHIGVGSGRPGYEAAPQGEQCASCRYTVLPTSSG